MSGIKNKDSGKWKRVAVFSFLLVVFVFLLNSVTNVYKKKNEAELTLTRMQGQLASLEAKDQSVKESIANISTQEGLEFELRQKLNVAAAGENVAVIVDEPQSTSSPITPFSPWQKFVNFLTELFK